MRPTLPAAENPRPPAWPRSTCQRPAAVEAAELARAIRSPASQPIQPVRSSPPGLLLAARPQPASHLPQPNRPPPARNRRRGRPRRQRQAGPPGRAPTTKRAPFPCTPHKGVPQNPPTPRNRSRMPHSRSTPPQNQEPEFPRKPPAWFHRPPTPRVKAAGRKKPQPLHRQNRPPALFSGGVNASDGNPAPLCFRAQSRR